MCSHKLFKFLKTFKAASVNLEARNNWVFISCPSAKTVLLFRVETVDPKRSSGNKKAIGDNLKECRDSKLGGAGSCSDLHGRRKKNRIVIAFWENKFCCDANNRHFFQTNRTFSTSCETSTAYNANVFTTGETSNQSCMLIPAISNDCSAH